MIGVNVDNLDTLIKKNNIYLNSFNSNYKRLVSAINELNSCYSGSSLEYLFTEPMKEIKNIQTISNVIENYSNILSGVKISYQQQDQTFKAQVNHMNSKL